MLDDERGARPPHARRRGRFVVAEPPEIGPALLTSTPCGLAPSPGCRMPRAGCRAMIMLGVLLLLLAERLAA
ncbi:hypothetical protein [Streptomyces longisporoflavus]|uniref:Uncharacterized protein n=1 Tax=Streptomyces longisporoflavus TaxID=28044 RepID=A0ABW7QGM8_9ACTN